MFNNTIPEELTLVQEIQVDVALKSFRVMTHLEYQNFKKEMKQIKEQITDLCPDRTFKLKREDAVLSAID